MTFDSKLISFLFRKARKKVLYYLEQNSPQTPKIICRNTNLSMGNLRRILLDLKEKGLVECDNQEDYHNKLYKITKKGIEVLKHIKKLDQKNNEK